MSYTVLINDITFYKSDEEGNPLLDDITGEVKVFRIKPGYRKGSRVFRGGQRLKS
jgi:hypothetical protein